MAKSTVKSMTEGRPIKLILGFSVPMLLGFLFQQFYNVVDTVIVGQILGKEALASVGSTGSLNFLIVGFCIGLCNGFAIPISHKFGAKDYVGMRQIFANGIWLSIAFSVVITTIVAVFCGQILTLMKTPADIFDGAYQYIFIIFIGIPAFFLFNLVASVMRALGDSKTPLICLTVSSFLNIGLDLLFILTFHLGVGGAALATILSQAVGGLLCLFFLIRNYDVLHLKKEELKINYSHMYVLCGVGIPMGLQYSITAIGSVILQTAVNSLGSAAVAAVTAASKVSMFFSCAFDALGSTMATYSGQNVGARKLDRLDQGLRSSVILGVAYSLAACLVLTIFGRELASLFVNSSEVQILEDARTMLMVNSFFFIPLALVNIVRFMIQGMGFSTFAILAGVCEMVARAMAGWLLVPWLGFLGVCFAGPLAWIMADLFLIPAYMYVKKRLEKQFAAEDAAEEKTEEILPT